MQEAQRIPAPVSRVADWASGGWGSLVSGRNADRTSETARVKNAARSDRLEVIPSLDGIRAISVLIVVLCHSDLEAVVPGGLGVTIFFFLSGYLITTLMLIEHERTGGINIPNFYARRVFRLMPPLLISLAIAYALTYAGMLAGGITVKGLTAQLLYFANYYGLFFDAGNTIPDGTGILWSLAVEEHFYIVYPLLLTLMLGCALRPRTIGALLGVACLVVLAWRIHLVYSPHFVSDRTYYASDTRIDSIIFGCILAIVMNPKGRPDQPATMSRLDWAVLAAATGALLLTLVYRDVAFRETIRYDIQGLALMPLFYFAIRFSDNRLFQKLNLPWMVTLGAYSYVIYLIHFVVIRSIVKDVPAVATKSFILFPAALLISIAYAAFIDRFVDPRFKRLRRKYGFGVAPKTAVAQQL